MLVDNPTELGADRLVNAIAAYDKYGGPAIVVDFGTATTFDVISARGEYLGGIITPAWVSAPTHSSAAQRAWDEWTSSAPQKSLGPIQSPIFRVVCITATLDSSTDILERMIAEMGSDPNDPAAPVIIATGGLASLIAEDSRYIETIDDLLTLDGLRLVFERNRSAMEATNKPVRPRKLRSR